MPPGINATPPVPGVRYDGSETGNPGINTEITFKVNDAGTKVPGLKTAGDAVFNFPDCEPTPDVTQDSKPTHISHKGKFRAVVHYTYSNDATAKAVVTGKFGSHGTEKRVISGTFPANPDCNGAAQYTADAR